MTPTKPAFIRLTGALMIFPLSVAALLTGTASCRAQSIETSEQQQAIAVDGRPYRDLSSRHFLIHTDLSDTEAQTLLERLEKTLRTISRYWGRPLSSRIECYVVKNLQNWRESDFPHDFARTLIGGVGGGAYADVESDGRKSSLKMTVYCTSELGVAEHEIVHAYCGQAFGSSGPDWYKEGMAELAFHSREGGEGVQCEQDVIDSLRKDLQKSAPEIVESGTLNASLKMSLEGMLSPPVVKNQAANAQRLQDWIREHGESVRSARDHYRWCWTLCHFLNQNANYATRFRALGKGYLGRQPRSYQQLFGSMQKEIDFEYRFFLDRIAVGYRVDLCCWNWKKKFRVLEGNHSLSVRVRAARGYQPSGVFVEHGGRYDFRAMGAWSTSNEGTLTDADGDAQNHGRLIGVVMQNYELSEPFDLGTQGTFTAPSNGRLYLRCDDRWNELADNRGSLGVQLQLPSLSLGR